jgi:hypothetical protein
MAEVMAEHDAVLGRGRGARSQPGRRRGAAADRDGDQRPRRLEVTDGPFVETKEALGGYYVIDAPDLDTALAVAKTVPARFGGVEVRPVMTFD